MELIKITPDKERAKSILKMVSLIEERISNYSSAKFSPLILSDYYEIIKELITTILLLDGYKTLSHKDLIDYLCLKVKEFNEAEIFKLDQLRILRNRISYEGFEIPLNYLKDNESSYIRIIKKLRFIINNKIQR